MPYRCKLSYAACTRYNLVFSWWLGVIIIYLFWLRWLVKIKEALTSGMSGQLKYVLTRLSPHSRFLPARVTVFRDFCSGSVCLVRYQSLSGDLFSVMLICDSIAWRVISSNLSFFFPASEAVLASTFLPSGSPSSPLLLFWLPVVAHIVQTLTSWFRPWCLLASALVAADILLFACCGPSVSHKPHVCFLVVQENTLCTLPCFEPGCFVKVLF